MAVKAPQLRYEQLGERPLNDLQFRTNDALRQLFECPFLFGQQFALSIATTATQTVYHTLGRIPQGAIVLRATGDNTLPVSLTSQWTTTQAAFQNNGATTGTWTIWLF